MLNSEVLPTAEPHLKASLRFLSRETLYETEKPYNHHYSLPTGVDFPRSNIVSETVDGISIRDLRIFKLNYKDNGIAILPFQSRMTYDDFWDQSKIENTFVSEIEECLLDYLGASEVHVYEYAVRNVHFCT